MDPRQREKLLAQIPTPDLRVEAFEKLGTDGSVELMLVYQDQLEQILAEAETKVPAKQKHINSRATLIGALVGTGLGTAEALLVRGNIISSSPEEVVKGVTALVAVATLFGGGIGFVVGNMLVGRTKSRFIHNREEPVQQRHRELLEAQLTDDQVAALFLKIAAEE